MVFGLSSPSLVADPPETREGGNLGFLKLGTNLLKAQISQLEHKKTRGDLGRGELRPNTTDRDPKAQVEIYLHPSRALLLIIIFTTR